ncbi:DUF6789 family protein [Idiomarina loihiensis]|uniref:DUF6789 family protein n=1 Tax=Idiomarina loihiensis TaxID=135577 RepID=UPI000C0F1701|nr:MAG: hypothetical protein COA80_11355 [Leeuwenhoekiella sp.]
MNNIVASFIAAFVATIVLSILMLIKSSMGVMPDLNVIKMLAGQMNSSAGMGWVAHFVIGTIGYGVGFAVLSKVITDKKPILLGIILGILGWLVMMVVLMPMMGQGAFAIGMESGPKPAIATLVLHIIFGFVLGYVGCKLTANKAS